MTFQSDIQTLRPGAKVEMFVLDLTVLGGPVVRFSNQVNPLRQPVVWQGNTYNFLPMKLTGVASTSKGTLARPKLQVAGIDGNVGVLVRAYYDLVGATIVRKQVMAKYLDAVNFAGGNPTANPSAGFDDDVYEVAQKTAEAIDVIEFELCSKLDIDGLVLPSRKIIRDVCTWNNASICPYSTGGLCAKTLAACQTHYPNQPIPFSGMLGATAV